MDSLFAYGTLLEPRIWKAVTGARSIVSEPATLPNHSIFRVEGADFPGILADRPGDEVPGRLFSEIDPVALARLDAYEDEFYERRGVEVILADGRTVPTQAYVVPERHRSWLSDERWTIEWFRTEALDSYLRRHGFEP